MRGGVRKPRNICNDTTLKNLFLHETWFESPRSAIVKGEKLVAGDDEKNAWIRSDTTLMLWLYSCDSLCLEMDLLSVAPLEGIFYTTFLEPVRKNTNVKMKERRRNKGREGGGT